MLSSLPPKYQCHFNIPCKNCIQNKPCIWIEPDEWKKNVKGRPRTR